MTRSRLAPLFSGMTVLASSVANAAFQQPLGFGIALFTAALCMALLPALGSWSESTSSTDVGAYRQRLSGQVGDASLKALASQGIELRSGLAVDWLTKANGGQVLLSLNGATDDPASRVVVIADPGRGKTIALLRRTIELQKLRTNDGDAVAVYFHLPGWVPASTSLRAWMVAKICENYMVKRKVAEDLVKSGGILPVLDGFDEIGNEARQSAAQEIREFWRLGLPMVLASRRDEFEEAFRSLRPITDATVIELEPFDLHDAIEHLDPKREPRWQGVRRAVDSGAGHPMVDVLTIPLFFGLIRDNYQDSETNPSELIVLTTSKAIHDRLLSDYLPRVLRAPRDGGKKFDPERGEHSLRFIAEAILGDSMPGIAWDRLIQWLSSMDLRGLRLLMGCLYSLLSLVLLQFVTGVVWDPVYLAVAAALSLFPGFFLSWVTVNSVSRAAKRLEPSRMHFSVKRLRSRDLWLALPVAVASSTAVVAVSFMLARALSGQQATSVGLAELIGGIGLFALLVWVLGAIAGGTSAIEAPLAQSPRKTLELDRNTLLVRAAVVFTIADSFFSVAIGWKAGLVFGLMFALVLTRFSAWWNFRLAAAYLALRGKLPWRVMGFLDECEKRGVLRQNGAVYQFRHEEIRIYLGEGAVGR